MDVAEDQDRDRDRDRRQDRADHDLQDDCRDGASDDSDDSEPSYHYHYHDSAPTSHRIDIYLHADLPLGSVLLGKLDALLTLARVSATKESHMAADLSSVKALVTAIDQETNNVATKVDAQTAKIAELQATIAAGGAVTAADLQELVDNLQPISDRLTALGANPADPIPLV